MVTVSWADAGPHGCIRRVYDSSDRTARYTLHAWLQRGECEFEPWNGSAGCAKRGRRITEQQAARMLEGES